MSWRVMDDRFANERRRIKSTFKQATWADRDMLATIIRESFHDVALRFALTKDNCPKHPSNCTAGWVESDMARGVRYFVLSVDERPIGCVGVECLSAGGCYLERLSVLPRMRGRHYGIMLVRYALAYAASKGAIKASIGIIAEQAELKAWYESLGFVALQTKTFPHLPFKVCLMAYEIKQPA